MADEPSVSKMVTQNPDRVHLSMKFTRQPREYESVSADIGLASDVRSGEKTSAAFQRVEKLVRWEFDELWALYEEQYGKDED